MSSISVSQSNCTRRRRKRWSDSRIVISVSSPRRSRPVAAESRRSVQSPSRLIEATTRETVRASDGTSFHSEAESDRVMNSISGVA